MDVLTKLIDTPVLHRNTEQPEPVRQHLGRGKVQERGQQETLGQVPCRPEDHHQARRHHSNVRGGCFAH